MEALRGQERRAIGGLHEDILSQHSLGLGRDWWWGEKCLRESQDVVANRCPISACQV